MFDRFYLSDGTYHLGNLLEEERIEDLFYNPAIFDAKAFGFFQNKIVLLFRGQKAFTALEEKSIKGPFVLISDEIYEPNGNEKLTFNIPVRFTIIRNGKVYNLIQKDGTICKSFTIV